jgi:hypothetical protein
MQDKPEEHKPKASPEPKAPQEPLSSETMDKVVGGRAIRGGDPCEGGEITRE